MKRNAFRMALAIGIVIVVSGCTSILLPVERDAAYAGSYPIVGTSQGGFWDNDGNSIAAPAVGAA